MGASFFREADKRMINDLLDKVEDARRLRKLSLLKVAAMARIKHTIVKNLIYAGGGTIRTLLRVIDALDYDIVLVKRQKVRTIFEVEGAHQQLEKSLRTAAMAKREARLKRRSLTEEMEYDEFENDFK